jgi:alpha-L-fucosidase
MHYEANLKSLQRHEVPAWYHDAKFGIFVHWGLYSIPAYAPLGRGDINRILREDGYGAFFTHIPYAEWYVNSIRIEGSPAQLHHAATYGKDAPYEAFAPEFRKSAENWRPSAWADLFRDAGARYVVLVTKHMDGFLMWPSGTPNPDSPDYGMERDIVGELTTAVKARSMRMGLYYSSALDQSFTKGPMKDVVGLLSEGGPIDRRYSRYQLAHWRELIDRYDPSILWGDIAYPPGTNPFALFAYYYNRNPEGVINDRWGQLPRWAHALIRSRPGRALLNAYSRRILKEGDTGNIKPPHYGYRTPEFAVMKDIASEKWETCRGMGLGFGYNREERDVDHLRLPDLIRMLVDIVSKNGNLLLNVGPQADGTIPAVQEALLRGIGVWLGIYGEGIYGTRPWSRAEGITTSGIPVRFTQKTSESKETVYLFFMEPISGTEVIVKDFHADAAATILDLATGATVSHHQDGEDLTLTFSDIPVDEPVHALSYSVNR